MDNVIRKENIKSTIDQLKSENKKIVFTNGCFDIIHAGHLDYLIKSKVFGDVLVVGINSDSSVKRIKGSDRPIISEKHRAFLLSNLSPVDFVIIFDEDTPLNLIKLIKPDVLIKGADWSKENIVGSDVVEQNGGQIETIDFVYDVSTSKIINKIKELNQN